ncbi:MAG: GntR family transcriptional regulator [Candidatus Pseudobacter hemicellulosilyticus]|uniref:GntR family transcriptional regulator n=1 Tax=Candidatus Pseudobacter hemicellulosilyticus TaxID=3121375 RepID=A0AAJ5WRK8_9BACT|nr:MAG: GntR family transcriptional regulator [Pseudobacter sp.]
MKKTPPLPLYRQLFVDLKKQIDEGKYKVGALLPSENELCAAYKTTRLTVRHALKELKTMGYITSHHGKGSIVSEPKKALGILSIGGITAAVGHKNLATKIIRKASIHPWADEFFYPLSPQETEAACISFTRVRSVDNAPIVYEETFLANLHLPNFTALSLENVSLFNTLLEKYQVEIRSGEQRIWAVSANKSTGKFLKVKEGSPVVHMQRKLVTNNKHLNIYSSLYCNTEDFYLQDYF